MSLKLFDHPLVMDSDTWEKFTESDHITWNILFERQSKLLIDRAAKEVIEGLDEIGISSIQIPKFSEINNVLESKTGFEVIPVKGYIPEDLFFSFLANRKFPSTCFIRKPHQLDYLEEPDIFHDIFGHIPLLINPTFADFMEEFGKKGLDAINHNSLKLAATLYWFTVEFGLIKTSQGNRIYGAGILSSKDETVYSLNSNIPKRIKFNLLDVFKTSFKIDELQKEYFVIENFSQLFDSLKNLDWQVIKDKNIFTLTN